MYLGKPPPARQQEKQTVANGHEQHRAIAGNYPGSNLGRANNVMVGVIGCSHGYTARIGAGVERTG